MQTHTYLQATILNGTIEKTSDLSTRRSQRAQSLSVFQTPLGSSNVSAFSACSAVKLGGIVISLEKSIVPILPRYTAGSRVLLLWGNSLSLINYLKQYYQSESQYRDVSPYFTLISNLKTVLFTRENNKAKNRSGYERNGKKVQIL